MRLTPLLLALTLFLAGAPVARAADDPAQTGPDAAVSSDSAGALPETREGKLDFYFKQLQDKGDPGAAKRAEHEIVSLWLQSGSDTIDLLMRWAVQAIDAKNYPLALDFLDRITVLKPDFVEGWNKRATVYYLTDQYDKAISDIAHTLSLEPRHFGALSGLGTILSDLGEDKRAIAAYKQALSLDPLLTEVRKALDELEANNAGDNI